MITDKSRIDTIYDSVCLCVMLVFNVLMNTLLTSGIPKVLSDSQAGPAIGFLMFLILILVVSSLTSGFAISRLQNERLHFRNAFLLALVIQGIVAVILGMFVWIFDGHYLVIGVIFSLPILIILAWATRVACYLVFWAFRIS